MSTSIRPKIAIAKRLRMSTSKTLDSHTYIRLYSEALEKHLEVEQRQSFFMVAKILTDGTLALNNNYSRLANYYFELSERYIDKIPADQKNHLHFIQNVYSRSKSLHYYKLGKTDKAIQLINNCLVSTIELEKKAGLEFLILDRISQSENLARVYFSTLNIDEGFEILSDCLVFLMTGKENQMRNFHSSYLKSQKEDYYEMRSNLMFSIITNVIKSLLKESDRDIFISTSFPILSLLFENIDAMVCHTQIDSTLKKWLEIIQHFYKNDILNFKKSAIAFNSSQSSIKGEKLANLASSFFSYC